MVRDLAPRIWDPGFGPLDLGPGCGPPNVGPPDLPPRISTPGFELSSLKPAAGQVTLLGSPVPDASFGSTGKESDLIGSQSIGSYCGVV